MDIPEGLLLWVKLGLLTLVAVVIPLFIPRQYIPVDPKVRACAHIFAYLVLIECIGPYENTKSRANRIHFLADGVFFPGPRDI